MVGIGNLLRNRQIKDKERNDQDDRAGGQKKETQRKRRMGKESPEEGIYQLKGGSRESKEDTEKTNRTFQATGAAAEQKITRQNPEADECAQELTDPDGGRKEEGIHPQLLNHKTAGGIQKRIEEENIAPKTEQLPPRDHQETEDGKIPE